MKHPCVYILASRPYGTLDVGVTSDLYGRMAQHAQGLFDGFTKTHGITSLVYFETHDAMPEAIRREKLVKRWNRAWKCRLIEQMNPEWANLFDPETGEIAFGSTDIEQSEVVCDQCVIAGLDGICSSVCTSPETLFALQKVLTPTSAWTGPVRRASWRSHAGTSSAPRLTG